MQITINNHKQFFYLLCIFYLLITFTVYSFQIGNRIYAIDTYLIEISSVAILFSAFNAGFIYLWKRSNE